jgi:TetR/AcrR family transcriptional repressor of nem operon
LDKAIDVFWDQGYARTSMMDLVEKMGVHKRSMYDTFGDKRSLFRQALYRYATREQSAQDEVIRTSGDCYAAVQSLLESAITKSETKPQGCLLVNCAVEDAMTDEDIALQVRSTFSAVTARFLSLVLKGQEDAQISRRFPATYFATQLFNTWLSVRVQIRAGINEDALHQSIHMTIAQLR